MNVTTCKRIVLVSSNTIFFFIFSSQNNWYSFLPNSIRLELHTDAYAIKSADTITNIIYYVRTELNFCQHNIKRRGNMILTSKHGEEPRDGIELWVEKGVIGTER